MWKGINNLLGDVFLERFRFLSFFSPDSRLFYFYLSARWLVAEVALMADGTGPLESLRRSWNLSRDYVLRAAGYLILLSIVMGLVGGLVGALVDFAVVALVPAVDQSWKSGSQLVLSRICCPSLPRRSMSVRSFVYYYDLRVRKERYDFESRCSDNSGGGVGSC